MGRNARTVATISPQPGVVPDKVWPISKKQIAGHASDLRRKELGQPPSRRPQPVVVK